MVRIYASRNATDVMENVVCGNRAVGGVVSQEAGAWLVAVVDAVFAVGCPLAQVFAGAAARAFRRVGCDGEEGGLFVSGV